MTFAPNQLSSCLNLTEKMKQDDDMFFLKKQMRQKEADFMKDKALLVQQVELLKMQLGESAERESNLKKMNENIMNAFQSSSNSPNKSRIEINEDHPQVADLIRGIKQEFRQDLQKEKEKYREAEYNLEKLNQQQEFRIQDLQRQVDHLQDDYESKSLQHTTLLHKYNEEVNGIHEKVKNDYEQTIKRLQNELDTINSDIERQVIIQLNQKYMGEQDFNETIIKYQKEQQLFLDEQIELRKKIEQLERDLLNYQDKLLKADDESGSLKYKIKQIEKKNKDDIEVLKKQKEDTQKKVDLLEKTKKSAPSTTSYPVRQNTSASNLKSRNKTSIYQQNKENVRNNQTELVEESVDTTDDEKNKLRRQVALYRCQAKKLIIELKDLKSNSQKEMAKLQDKLNVEKKKRMGIYEDKIDKNNQLLQDLLDKDQTIFQLNRQITKLQEQLGTNRTQTPNHFLNSLQESMVQNVFTQSMIDLGNNICNQANHSSKRLISPLRSLDLTMLNNHNLSFNVNIPKMRNQSKNKKKKIMLSPKQIKRNRVHSVRIPEQNNGNMLTQSVKRIRGHSRDASIAEVNEDLYKDSVESNHDDDNYSDDQTNFDKTNINLPFDKSHNKRMNYCQSKADEELNHVLNQDKPRNDVYCDSLENEMYENEGFQRDTELSKNPLSTRCQAPSGLLLDIPKHKQQAQNNKKPLFKKRKNSNFNEDDDCLVNILDQEETNIEVQPTLMHTRQHLSTENLFKEINNTIENLQSFRNLKSKFPVNKKKQEQRPVANNNSGGNQAKPIIAPKPYNSYQSAAVQRPIKQNDLSHRFEQFKSNNSSLKPDANFGDNIMKSPSSPNFNFLPSNHNQQRILSSGSSKKDGKYLRLDSCPSPSDENETVILLGSGEKLRVKEVNQSKMDTYANQFKEQRNKFSATIKPPQSNKHINQSNNQQQFMFRTRTNSLINSVCQEISLKMKFMPANEPQNPQPQKIEYKPSHNRISSMNVSNQSSQKLLRKNLSPREFK